MRVAVLGATSQIARDLIVRLAEEGHDLCLFARDPARVAAWLQPAWRARCEVAGYASFPACDRVDAIVNCVGIGDPAKAAAMGASILEVTRTYDELALAYLQRFPDCRYVFLSSGAAYGTVFEQPVDERTSARFPLNALGPEHWYGLAKLHAELGHRARGALPIVDLRIFSYFSRTQDMGARFFLSDALRALLHGEVLRTSPAPMVRDFVHPADLFSLLKAVLDAPPRNDAADVYSRSPVDKPALLGAMRDEFGLRFEVAGTAGVNATGDKPRYYSLNRRAALWGYDPAFSSLEGVLHEMRHILREAAAT